MEPRTERDVTSDMTWRDDNTEGYSAAELAALNSEFLARWLAGEWPGAEDAGEAARWFAFEVIGRP